jgi:hypothetical protein
MKALSRFATVLLCFASHSARHAVTWGKITRAQICALVKNLLSAECSHEDEVTDSCDKALSPVIMFIP